jgi:Secretion system C-terminal sorting domain
MGAVTIHPNPSAEKVVVQCYGAMPTEIQVYALTGQLVKVLTVHQNGAIVVDISDLESGMYICRVVGGDHVAAQKVVKL